MDTFILFQLILLTFMYARLTRFNLMFLMIMQFKQQERKYEST